MNKLKVLDKEIEIKEYNSNRIVTAWDIAELHEKSVSEVGQQFKRNKKYLIENVDYILLNRNDISVSQIVIQKKIPNNVKFIPIFTESGYLMLVKSFNDELSWEVQRILINSYFKVKELQQNNFKVPQTFKEALLLAVEQQEEIERLELENNKNMLLIEEQKPKVEFFDTVTKSDKTFDMNTVSKIINFKGVGRNNLFSILRSNGILQYNNQPYQKYVNKGWFKVVEKLFNDKFGNSKINYKTVVYQKGIDNIIKLLKRLGYTNE